MIVKRTKRKASRSDPRKGAKREAYNVPDEIDLTLLEEKIAKYMAKLNEDGSPKKGVTIFDVKRLVRKAVREEWMRCPTKLAFLNMGKVPDLDPTTRTRFLIQCECCRKMFKESDIEIDHKEGNKTFTEVEDVMEWANQILNVKFSDLQRLCIPCHKTKSRAEMAGTSLEEAKILLQMDEICRGAGNREKGWLLERGITPKSNKEARKQQVIDFLKENNKNDW